MLELHFFFKKKLLLWWAAISKWKNDFSGRPKCKSMVRYDIGITQCDDWTVKCKEKNRLLSNVTKVLSEMMLVLPNVIMKLSNLRKKNRVPLNVTKVE